MAKIIIADDEQLIRRLVSDFLKKDGFTVLEAENGEEALHTFEKNKDTDLLILDIMMPEKDGWEVCSEIRKTSSVPILLLSARSEEFDQLKGFESGADDYVTKPFSTALLMKRVEALLKRNQASDKTEDDSVQGLTVNKTAHQVFVDGKEILLTVKEFNILLKLIENIGRVYSREQLLDDIWGFDYYGDTRTVDSHVARLRTKLGDWGNRHLKTVYGVGYKIQERDVNE